MSELLPCPHCGSRDIKQDNHTGIYCKGCAMWFGVMDGDPKVMREKWNRRTAYEVVAWRARKNNSPWAYKDGPEESGDGEYWDIEQPLYAAQSPPDAGEGT